MYIVHQQILKVVDDWSIISTAVATLPFHGFLERCHLAWILLIEGNIKEHWGTCSPPRAHSLSQIHRHSSSEPSTGALSPSSSLASGWRSGHTAFRMLRQTSPQRSYHCHQRSIQPRRLAVHGTAKEVAVVLQGGDQLGDDLDVCVAVWIIEAIFLHENIDKKSWKGPKRVLI